VEVNAVLSSIAVDSDAGVMHHAALSILLYLGLRAAELRSLTLESLGKDRDVHTITIDGKGNRKRIIPLPAEVILSLDRYLRSYARASIREALFTATNRKDGKPLSHEALTKIVKKYSRLAGISKTISPHSLRATCVSNALENGASMVQVQYLAGWKSSAMIQRYDKRSSILKNSAAYAVNYNKE
jgi:integrase/recombinase XerD